MSSFLDIVSFMPRPSFQMGGAFGRHVGATVCSAALQATQPWTILRHSLRNTSFVKLALRGIRSRTINNLHIRVIPATRASMPEA